MIRNISGNMDRRAALPLPPSLLGHIAWNLGELSFQDYPLKNIKLWTSITQKIWREIWSSLWFPGSVSVLTNIGSIRNSIPAQLETGFKNWSESNTWWRNSKAFWTIKEWLTPPSHPFVSFILILFVTVWTMMYSIMVSLRLRVILLCSP